MAGVLFMQSAADDIQHLAVSRHGLNQILSKSVLHNKNTSIIECEKFCFYHRGSDVPLNRL